MTASGPNSALTFSLTRSRQWLFFSAWAGLSLCLFLKPIIAAVQLALADDTYSHIILVPLVSAWVLYAERNQADALVRPSIRPGLVFLIVALMIAFPALFCSSCSPRSLLALYISSLIFFVIAGFSAAFGWRKTKASLFALTMLFLIIPIPDFVLGKIIYWLQSGSATIAEFFFNISGAPVLRDGFVFRLPRISIEVAQECSGIRSSLALLILALLVAHFSFQSFWKKSVFVLAGLCMMLIKNGIRIASLTLLANYVNPDFLYGDLHRKGGIVFFLIGLALLFPVFWLLRKGEITTSVRSID
ncbi:MAG TPA: exosortase/archaeosortase family protein [Candidatus Acidoferrum sp.]|nr:exosortase/archaeosortase family protein [Candidatus Acidoferrum sp.]